MLNIFFKKIDTNNIKNFYSILFKYNNLINIINKKQYKDKVNKEKLKYNNYKNELIVKFFGIFRAHTNKCLLIDCFCKKKILLSDPSKDIFIEINGKKDLKFSEIYYKNLISQFFLNLNKNNNNPFILLNLGNYLYHYLKIIQRSIIILFKIKIKNSLNYFDNFYLEFLFWKIKRKSIEYDKNLNKNNKFSNIDIFKIVEMENDYKKLYQNIKKYSLNYLNLLELLNNNYICLNIVDKNIKKIEKNLKKIFNIYKKSKNIPRIMELYKIFLDNLGFWINKKDFSKFYEILIEKAKICKKENNQSKIDLIYDEKSAILKMGGDEDNLGLILNINKGMEKITGYSIKELENHKINKILPEIISIVHQKYLIDSKKTGLFRIIYQERKLFLLTKNKFILPINLLVKPMFDVKKLSFIYISYLQKINSFDGYLLTNKYGKIDSYTENIHYILKYFNKVDNLYIQYLCNELFDLFIYLTINQIKSSNFEEALKNKKLFENIERTVNHNYKIKMINYNNIVNFNIFDEFINMESIKILKNQIEFDNFLFLNKEEFISDLTKKLYVKKLKFLNNNIFKEDDFYIEFNWEPIITLTDIFYIFSFKKIYNITKIKKKTNYLLNNFMNLNNKSKSFLIINQDKDIKKNLTFNKVKSKLNNEYKLLKNNIIENKFFKKSNKSDIENKEINSKSNKESNKKLEDNNNENSNSNSNLENSMKNYFKFNSTSSISHSKKNKNFNIYSLIIYNYLPKEYKKIIYIKYFIIIIFIFTLIFFLLILFFSNKFKKEQLNFQKLLVDINFNIMLCANAYNNINYLSKFNNNEKEITISRLLLKDKNKKSKELLNELNKYNPTNISNEFYNYFFEKIKFNNFYNEPYNLNLIGNYLLLINNFNNFLNNKEFFDKNLIENNIEELFINGRSLSEFNNNQISENLKWYTYIFIICLLIWLIVLILFKWIYIIKLNLFINDIYEYITKFSKKDLNKLWNNIKNFLKYVWKAKNIVFKSIYKKNSKTNIYKINKIKIDYKKLFILYGILLIIIILYFYQILENYDFFNKNRENLLFTFYKRIQEGTYYNNYLLFEILKKNKNRSQLENRVNNYSNIELSKLKNLSFLKINNFLNKNVIDSISIDICTTNEKEYFLDKCLTLNENITKKGYENLTAKQIEYFKFLIKLNSDWNLKEFIKFMDINFYNLNQNYLIKNELVNYINTISENEFFNLIIISPIFILIIIILLVIIDKTIIKKLKKKLLKTRKFYRIFPDYLFKDNIKLMSYWNIIKNKNIN